MKGLVEELEEKRNCRINNIWVRQDENETISCKVNNPPKIKDPHSTVLALPASATGIHSSQK